MAVMFKALGDPTRLRIFQFLRRCTCQVALDDEGLAMPVDGPTVGAVCCSVLGRDKAPSTLSFHLKELRNAGLIRMERRGQCTVCAVETRALEKLTGFFEKTGGNQ